MVTRGKNMNILHFLGLRKMPLNPDGHAYSGVVCVALELARHQVKIGHKVTVAVVAKSKGEAYWQGVRLVHLPYQSWAKINLKGISYHFGVRFPFVIFSILNNFDIVHSHMYNNLQFIRAGLRVIHFHSDPFFPGNINDKKTINNPKYKMIINSSQVQIAISKFVATAQIKLLDGSGNIHVVLNGVDPERFNKDEQLAKRKIIRDKWDLSNESIVILYAGALIEEKGVIHLANVFSRISQKLPNIYLMIAGSSALWGNFVSNEDTRAGYEAQLYQVLNPLISNKKVFFLGLVPSIEMPAIYAASDFVVVPSICQEAFGLVALEALAAGRPVIASETGGLPEIVNRENGILVKPGDETGLENAILAFAQDASLRKRLGENGRIQAQRFSWQSSVEQLDRIYQNALQRGKA